MPYHKIFMGMPHRGSMIAAAAKAFYCDPLVRVRRWEPEEGPWSVERFDKFSSLLTTNFNRLWCRALDLRAEGFTHFVMQHSDVAPDAGGVDILVQECDRLEADVVSAVVPLKDGRGLTSTALGWTGLTRKVCWRGRSTIPVRRLSMTEVFELPETFCRDDVKLEGPPTLWINTGFWVADLRKPWVEQVVFRNLDWIHQTPSGRWTAECLGEDWGFSCDLAEWGAKVYATRKVGLFHEHPAFQNRYVWGQWQTDQVYTESRERHGEGEWTRAENRTALEAVA